MASETTGNDAPVVVLRRWRVMEVVAQNGLRSRHLLGHDVTHDEDRVSSPIADFKMESMTATTRSGARYRLAGVPGQSRKVLAAWDDWCLTYGVASQRDVTAEYMDPDDVSTRQFAALSTPDTPARPR
ncbi:MAG TPA: hypothetical protein VKC56_11010 [Gallionellaceae bacterium]|nr:hypothetical protein [Gallionellaceae bacterium]